MGGRSAQLDIRATGVGMLARGKSDRTGNTDPDINDLDSPRVAVQRVESESWAAATDQVMVDIR